MKLYASALLLILFTSPTFANPGAWVLDEGKWQIIHNLSYYSADERYNPLGASVPQPTYTKREYNPYIEYGLWNHTTVGANLFLQDASANGSSNFGLADAEIFVRSCVYSTGFNIGWLGENDLVVSLQPLIKFPGWFDDGNSPTIGSNDTDIALSALAGFSFHYFKQKTFIETDLQYRRRLGTPKDQWRASTSLGQNITDDWQIIAQSFVTLSADNVRGATFTQSTRDDYDLVKAQLSAVYNYSDELSFQLGGSIDAAGRNTGNGSSVIFAIWHRF